MSGSNPFRRNHRPAGISGHLNDRLDAGNNLPSLKVEVPPSTRSTTKHVRIASPPVPISPETPASYASSPEETRQAKFPGSPSSPDSDHVPYAQALALNPFQASSSDGERDDVDQELLDNTRRNSALGSEKERDRGDIAPDAAKAALARFVGLPQRSNAPPVGGSGDGNELSKSQSSRPALDVDAFKRLLLTGESGMPPAQARPVSAHGPSQPAIASDSSSSNADTASVSQHSIFEPLPSAVTDTPRTSYEWDREEAVRQRGVILGEATAEKKPPIPRPHYGRSLDDNATLQSQITRVATRDRRTVATFSPEFLGLAAPSDLNKPLPPPPVDNSFPAPTFPEVTLASTRSPPAPPLARRRSQRRGHSVEESSHTSSEPLSTANENTAFQLDQESRIAVSKPPPPPPPPARRQKRTTWTDLHSSEATVQEEEDDLNITSTQRQLSPASSTTSLSQSKPQPPPSRTPSGAKRLSHISTGSPSMAPPLPPPRKARALSRSSFDSQSAVLLYEPRGSNEFRRTSTDSSRDVSGQSTSKDILADLAALQKEVDLLRNRQGNEGGATK